MPRGSGPETLLEAELDRLKGDRMRLGHLRLRERTRRPFAQLPVNLKIGVGDAEAVRVRQGFIRLTRSRVVLGRHALWRIRTCRRDVVRADSRPSYRSSSRGADDAAVFVIFASTVDLLSGSEGRLRASPTGRPSTGSRRGPGALSSRAPAGRDVRRPRGPVHGRATRPR